MSDGFKRLRDVNVRPLASSQTAFDKRPKSESFDAEKGGRCLLIGSLLEACSRSPKLNSSGNCKMYQTAMSKCLGNAGDCPPGP